MRYISEKVVTPNGLFRSRDGEPLGDSDGIVRPSDLLGTVKRSLDRRRGHGHHGVRRAGGGSGRCQCKHHQQRHQQLRELAQRQQEEQRRQLKRQLVETGDRRRADAIVRHTNKWQRTCPIAIRSRLGRKSILLRA